MTLDERAPIEEHRALREPEWMRLSRITDAERAEEARLDREEQDAAESVEAEEQKWVGIREQRPDWFDRIHHERDVPDRADAGGMPYFREGS